MAPQGKTSRKAQSKKPEGRRKARYKEAKDRTKFMKRIAHDLEARLKEEHDQGPPYRNNLEKNIASQQERLNLVQSKIRAKKDQAKNRKREIDEWKDWYARIPEIDKQEEWEKVTNEATWRGTEITDLETQISEMETEKLGVIIELEMAQDQLAALEAGAYELPLKSDPRLIAVRSELEEVKKLEKKAKSSVAGTDIKGKQVLKTKSLKDKTKKRKQKKKSR